MNCKVFVIKEYNMSVKNRLYSLLKTGQTISVAQARNRFRAKNISARVNDLRNDGVPVQTIRTKTGRMVYALKAG